MKLRKNKKGFTIVELVIVIAVIGVLAAVLVPTFVNLTQKANEAADLSLVKNLNTALKMEEQEAGHQPSVTLQGAVDDLEKQGYLLDNLVSKSGQDLLWNQETNEFELDKDGKKSGKKYWKIVNAMPADQKFCYYAGKGFTAKEVEVKLGFDAGYHTDINTIKYDRTGATTAQDVSIRTNGGKLIIKDTNDQSHQYHYGTAASVEVETANNCYEGHAVVAAMNVKAGKVIAASNAYIGVIESTENVTLEEKDSGVLVIPENADVEKIPATVASQIGYTKGEESFTPTPEKAEKSYYVIDSAKSLTDFVTGWNNGDEAIQLIKLVKFASDVTFDYTATAWTPLGTWEQPFNGTIDGNNCTIKGLGGVIQNTAGQNTAGSSTGNAGQSYGFIAIAGNGDLTVKNINFADVSIDFAEGNMVAAVVGFAASNKKFTDSKVSGTTKWQGNTVIGTHDVTISNIKVSGSIKALNDAAGIAGKLYNSGKQLVSNCVVDAKIFTDATASSGRAAGVVSMVSGSNNILIENCVNKQNVVANVYAAGILGFASSCTGVIKGCQNSGEIFATYKGQLWNNQAAKVNITIK